MKGVITIAGYGTRFLPASKAVPKEMFPILGIPLIQYHVESLVAAGITEIIVVVREGGEIVQRHFAPSTDLELHLESTGKRDLLEEIQRLSRLADIVVVRQPETLPYGNASPALAARPWLNPGEPFYYMFGDDIILADVPVPQQLLGAFRKCRPAAVLATQWVPDEETHLYGCIELKPGSEHEMARVVEKPAPGTAPSNWVQIGHFVFAAELFDVLRGSELGKGGELWLADAVDRLAARSTVVVQPIDGLWMAAGDPLRQLKASIEMALRRDDLRGELIAYLRALEL
jgi:UTP--glucose-1-phosphate uridylyltransferase